MLDECGKPIFRHINIEINIGTDNARGDDVWLEATQKFLGDLSL